VPLKIEDDPTGTYKPNLRSSYRYALLRVFPFNNYSGTYGATGCQVLFDDGTSDAFVMEYRTAYVVDTNTVFFYAGVVTEDWEDRASYKIFVRFNSDETLTYWAENPSISFTHHTSGVGIAPPAYNVIDVMDEVRPYIKRRYITINMNYDYTDYTSVPGKNVRYRVRGTLTMERVMNTQIPDEDQAILW